MTKEISRKEWEDATNTFVVVMIWQPKPKAKRQVPIVRVAGDYPTRSKANSAMKKIIREAELRHAPDRRTLFVAKKFDVQKLDLHDDYIIKDDEASGTES